MSFISKKKLNYYEATAALVGTVIGAGVLGIPFVVVKVGFLLGALFILVIGFLLIKLHLMLGEVVVNTKEPLQLAGLARKYLGKWAGRLMGILYIFALNGVLLAYIVGEGSVLSSLLPGSPYLWSIIFFIPAAFIVIHGVGLAKHVELGLNIAMFVIIGVIIILGIRGFEYQNLTTFSLSDIFLPFGVILLAFSGISAIPVVEIIDQRKREFKHVITNGMLIPIVIYFLFTLVVVAVTGVNTTEVATIGLGQALGNLMVVFGNLFAIFAMGTSFILIGLALVGVYNWDYKIKKLPASILTAVVPFFLFLLGAREFIKILGLVGSLFVSIEMILIVFMFLKVRKITSNRVVRYLKYPRLWAVVLVVVLAVAGGLGVWDWFFGV